MKTQLIALLLCIPLITKSTINDADTLVFDLANGTQSTGMIEIPVYIASDDIINSIDFTMVFNNDRIVFNSINVHKTYLSSFYNSINDSTLLFTANSLQDIENNVELFSISFELLNEDIEASDIESIIAYLNGGICGKKITTEICTGDSTTLIIPEENDNTYLWSTGETTNSITVSSSGEYYATITDGDDNTKLSTITQVDLLEMPNATINPSPLEFCEGDSGVLNAQTEVGYSYLWSTGDTTQNIYVKSTGLYNVEVTDSNGCKAVSENATIVINPLPNSSISANGPTKFCEGDSVNLSVDAGNTYVWSNSQTTNNITVLNSGGYTVTVTDNNGCSSVSSPLTVEAVPLPDSSITPSGPLKFCTGDSVILQAVDVVGHSYMWSTGEISNEITVNTTGNYSVHVTNSDNCSSTSNSVPVTVGYKQSDMNKDGSVNVNDFLTLLGKLDTTCNWCAEDLDHNGVINVSDLLILIGEYGTTCL